MKGLIIQLETQQEQQELLELGLSSEEVDGYFEFFIDNWLDLKEERE